MSSGERSNNYYSQISLDRGSWNENMSADKLMSEYWNIENSRNEYLRDVRDLRNLVDYIKKTPGSGNYETEKKMEAES